jgi:hypothetical protein
MHERDLPDDLDQMVKLEVHEGAIVPARHRDGIVILALDVDGFVTDSVEAPVRDDYLVASNCTQRNVAVSVAVAPRPAGGRRASVAALVGWQLRDGQFHRVDGPIECVWNRWAWFGSTH